MTEVIVFPDAEAVLVAALQERLSVPVSTRVPATRPAEFVRLSLIGGSRPNMITDRSMVVVEAWAKSTGAAAALAQLAQAHLHALAPDVVRRTKVVTGMQSFPDPLSEAPRYQFTVQIDLRGAALDEGP